MKIRNWKRKAMATIAAGGAFVAADPGLANADEVLDFDAADTGLATNDDLLGTGYGSNSAGALNIAVAWDGGWDAYNGWDGRGDVGQIDYNASGGAPITTLFTPDAGFGVFVTSFDLDEFVGGGDSVVNWSLLGTAFSGTWDDFNDANAGDGGRTNIVTGMTMADAVSGPLTLEFSFVSGSNSYLAVDNISFGQVSAVPEPGSVSVLAMGLGAVLLRRRKR